MSLDSSRILYEDNYLLAVNKRSGELVVKGAGKVQKLPLLDFLKKDYPELQTLHRLDFETSGTVLFAKGKSVAAKAKDQLSGWKKTYTTLVAGRMNRPQGSIRKKLPTRAKSGSKFNARTGKSKTANQEFVAAVTHYRTLERFANSSLLEVDIETGRHHQIRRHLQMIGYPLVLDTMYGDKRFNAVFTQEFKLRKFFLHATSLQLQHPITGETLHVEAPLPAQFQNIVQVLQSL